MKKNHLKVIFRFENIKRRFPPLEGTKIFLDESGSSRDNLQEISRSNKELNANLISLLTA